jgi:hypothetical protein
VHVFNWHTLFYLSLHLVGGFFCLASMLGIPGNLEDSHPSVKKLNPCHRRAVAIGLERNPHPVGQFPIGFLF